MKGHQFLKSKHQCACTIRISDHAIDRLSEAIGETSRARARVLLGDAEVLDISQTHDLGYRPRMVSRLIEKGETSYYLRIRDVKQEGLAVLTDDPGDKKLVWVTTYKVDEGTDVRRTIKQFRMGRNARERFLKRRRGG